MHNNLLADSSCESDMTCDTLPSPMNLFAVNDDFTVILIMEMILKVIWINQNNMHWLRLFKIALTCIEFELNFHRTQLHW